MSSTVLPIFPSKSFIISGLILRSLIHLEFIFVYDVRKCSNFTFLHVTVQFFQHHLLKRVSLPHCMYILFSFVKNKVPISAQVYFLAFYIVPLAYTSVFFCQYHAVLMTVALQYNLKSRRFIPLAPFFFLKNALSIQGLFCFHV